MQLECGESLPAALWKGRGKHAATTAEETNPKLPQGWKEDLEWHMMLLISWPPDQRLSTNKFAAIVMEENRSLLYKLCGVGAVSTG
jgi:hypothetical protein